MQDIHATLCTKDEIDEVLKLINTKKIKYTQSSITKYFGFYVKNINWLVK